MIQVAHTFGGQISSHFLKKTTTSTSLCLYQIVICRKKRQKKSMFKTPLRPTGIQIATKKKLCDSTSSGTDQYQNGSSNLLTPCIESSLDRLGLLSPTHDQRSRQQTGKITFQLVLINKSKFLKAKDRTKVIYSEVRGARGSLLYT